MLGDRRLSDQARELLASERGFVEDGALKARVLERARAELSLDRPSGVELRRGLMAVGQRSRAPLRTLGLIAAAVALAGLAAAAVSVYGFGDAPSPTSTMPVTPPAVIAPPARAPAEQLAPTPTPETIVSVPAPDASPKKPAAIMMTEAARARQYERELELLEPARTSIAAGSYAAALSAIGRHQRAFPEGRLTQEREALRVRALWGAGQKTEALALAKSFRKRYPRSGLLGWMKGQSEGAP